jgi:toxin ParE1/3/4
VAQFVTQRPRARLDLLEQFVYFGEQSGVALSERYFDAMDDTCSALSSHPLSGVLYDTAIAGLKGLRRFPVRDFENYLIFYLPVEQGIDVVRVLHAARDIISIFELEEAP